MRTRPLFSILVALLALTTIRAQVKDPIPAPITNHGLSVEIRDVARLPDSRLLHPADEDVAPTAWARVSYVRDLPDGRRFANDSREVQEERAPRLVVGGNVRCPTFGHACDRSHQRKTTRRERPDRDTHRLIEAPPRSG